MGFLAPRLLLAGRRGWRGIAARPPGARGGGRGATDASASGGHARFIRGGIRGVACDQLHFAVRIRADSSPPGPQPTTYISLWVGVRWAGKNRFHGFECGTVVSAFLTNVSRFCCTTLPFAHCTTLGRGNVVGTSARGVWYSVFSRGVRMPQTEIHIEVADDFHSELAFAKATGAEKQAAVAKQVWRRRAIALLKRKAPMAPDDEDRVVKRFRTKALNATLRIDNAMKVQFGFGLQRYILAPELDQRPPEIENWPRLSMVRDEGSDMTCMCHYLTRKMNMNIDHITDFNHAEWNCLKAAIKDTHMWGHLLVFAVAANTDYGPYNEERFFLTLKQSFKEYLEVADASCPLFGDALEQILLDKGEGERMGSADVAEEVFQDFSGGL